MNGQIPVGVFVTVEPRMPSRPQSVLPPGACDTHSHVFGPFDTFPLVLPASYSLPVADAARYRSMLATSGAQRGVLVQPAPYATDPAALLDALAVSGGILRGVAVANADTSEALLQEWYDAGVRGLRFVEMRDPQGNAYQGSADLNVLKALAPAMRRVGLHAQLWAPCAAYPRLLSELAPLGVPLILDHMASLKVDEGVNGDGFQALLGWLDSGQVWIKLSVCRVSTAAPDYADLKPFHDALVARNKTRLLWGSDWPFVRMGERSPDVGQLLDLFYRWVPDGATRQRILVDNPAALYGYA
ncbi:MAG: 2-pyrone-4,6-dicarboxylate hydrolase [Rhodoferax sp.]|nr:2-pyrone-4,6-dicarboxylate hydrolase [Rhodoferax sp.]